MWEITRENDDRWVHVLDMGETFDSLSDAKKKSVYESAIYLREKVELELHKRIGEIQRLAESLTAEEWTKLPESVCEFLLRYKLVEEDDD